MNKENNSVNIPEELDNLCLSIGRFIQYWGFKEIEGRIWCHLLLSNEPLCAQELMTRTGVSKGLMSISLARLLEFDVIRHEYTEGRRTQYFQVNEDITSVIKNVLNLREKRMINDTIYQVDQLLELNPSKLKNINMNRLKYLKKTILTGKKILNSFILTKDFIQKFSFGMAPKIQTSKEE